MCRLIAVMLATAGCAAPVGPRESDKLIGGEARAELDAVVAIYGPCTATRVGPRHLLTAAHCVAFEREGLPLRPQFQDGALLEVTGDREFNPELPLTYFTTVETTHLHPVAARYCDEQGCTPGHFDRFDIAVVVLTEELDSAIATTQIDLRPAQEGDPLVKSGYGCEAPGGGGDWLRLKRSPTYATEEHFETLFPAWIEYRADFFSMVVLTPGLATDPDGASLCHGDSGGPLLRDELVVGVNTRAGIAEQDISTGHSLADVHVSTAGQETFLRLFLPEESFSRH